ncbi:hypothetical protein CBM2631_B190036 [Cupriavidus taiwanensis]|nr:hypothetical protein CBM2588_B190128 [Cupriavidus taiwanensis]SOZ71794.1 hypothetical protein CBM2617_B180131 [Cupriavidus taiwanensis]SPA20421.1 hypothetical protein CBM2631_B190036 [Cupriavidus taiwanensis]
MLPGQIGAYARVAIQSGVNCVLDLFVATAQDRSKTRGSHRAGHLDFSLAAGLAPKYRGVFPTNNADGRSG